MRRLCVDPSELQTRSAHLYLYISDGVRHDVIQQFDVTAHALFLGSIRLKPISHQWPKYSWRAKTSCKNVETLSRKNDLSCFKSLLVTGLWDITLTSLLPPIQICCSRFWVWSCIASNFDKGWRGDHKHKIMDRPFMPKYSTVSQVLLQLVVADLFIHRLRNNVYYRWISSNFSCKWNRTANTRTISLKILDNLALRYGVTKHFLLADGFIPYRLSWASVLLMRWNAFTLGFHCLNSSHSSEKYLWIFFS